MHRDQKGLEEENDNDTGMLGRFPILLKPISFTVLLCMYVVLQSMFVSGLTPAVISTLEVRYGLLSSQSGFLPSAYDTGVLILVLPISFYGATHHKPRILGIGMFVMGIGALLFALPQFVGSKYQPGVILGAVPVCPDPQSPCSASSPTPLYAFLAIGQLLVGMGACSLYTLGPACLDENVTKSQLAGYLGVFYALSAIGPAIGFIGGGSTLAEYVDPGPVPAGLTIDNPEWVGRWWLCFLYVFAFAIVCSLPFGLFPKHLPGTAHIRRAKAEDTEVVGETVPLGGSNLSFLQTVKILMVNKPYMFNIIGQSAETFIVSGVAAFISKIVQAQYGITADSAAILTGVIVVPGAAGGMLAGGIAIARFKSSARNVARMCAFTAITAFLLFPLFMVGCDAPSIAGVNTAYPDGSPTLRDVQMGMGESSSITSGDWRSRSSSSSSSTSSRSFLDRLDDAWMALLTPPPQHQQRNNNNHNNNNHHTNRRHSSFVADAWRLNPATSSSSSIVYADDDNNDHHDNTPPQLRTVVPVPACATSCNCVTRGYTPTCTGGITYYNPCFAGCNASSSDDSTFSGCVCAAVSQGLTVASAPATALTGTSGYCPESTNCPSGTLPGFLVILFLVMFFTFMNNTPSQVAILRCVPLEARSTAMAFSGVVYRILGSIPGPIIYGALLDNTCVLRSEGCDGGACVIYDTRAIRRLTVAMGLICKGISSTTFSLSWYFYKPDTNALDSEAGGNGGGNGNAGGGAHRGTDGGGGVELKQLNLVSSSHNNSGYASHNNVAADGGGDGQFPVNMKGPDPPPQSPIGGATFNSSTPPTAVGGGGPNHRDFPASPSTTGSTSALVHGEHWEHLPSLPALQQA